MVVTEAWYSRAGYQQTVVPVLDRECEERSLDVVIADAPWLARLGEAYSSAILAAPMVSTLYLADHISRFLDVVVPAETMAKLEASLVAHFGL